MFLINGGLELGRVVAETWDDFKRELKTGSTYELSVAGYKLITVIISYKSRQYCTWHLFQRLLLLPFHRRTTNWATIDWSKPLYLCVYIK